MSQVDITLSITLSPDDVDVLQRIRDRWGYAVDETGIIQHILNEYYQKAEVDPPARQWPSEK